MKDEKNSCWHFNIRSLFTFRCKTSWEDAAKQLQIYLSHIEALNHESFKSLQMSEDDNLVNYGAKFDLSKGDNLKVKHYMLYWLLRIN